jgi:alkylhydroperoxidase/carboxymuconolactone decarboxylase family protein YurZ
MRYKRKGDDMAIPRQYPHTTVVPMPSDDDVRRVMGDGYDPGSALNVTKMFAGTEDFFPALIGMVQAVFGTPDIDAKHREMIVLRSASVLNVPYEWQANSKMAANAGLTADEIQAAASDGPVQGVAEEYVLICRATDELLGDGTLSDPTLAGLLETFGATVTRKYIATIAWFSMLSLFLNGTRVPLETTDKIGDRTSPLG